MLADAKAYGHQFPAYRENPIAETLRASKAWRKTRTLPTATPAFRRDMVYGESPEFETALAHDHGFGGPV